MTAYGELCTEFYDLDKPVAPAHALAFYLARARAAGGPVLEPMCGSGRFLLPMVQAGLSVEGVDTSPAMLDACRRRARRLGLDVTLYQQDLEAMVLPHRYNMAFVPSGSIGLVTTDAAIRRVLAGLHSHLQPHGMLYLEVMDNAGADDDTTVRTQRTVACPDGSTITYQGFTSRLRESGIVLFSDTYHRRRGGHLIASETEEMLFREYYIDEITEALESCGFRHVKLFRSTELNIPANSGCSLIEASAEYRQVNSLIRQ